MEYSFFLNNLSLQSTIFTFYFKDFILFYFYRWREGEKEGEKHQCVVAPRAPPTGSLAYNPGMRPDWESNQQPFGSQASGQSTEPHQPGHYDSS